MEINELYRDCNYIKWDMLRGDHNIWQLKHKDTGFLFTVRLMFSGKARQYVVNVPTDPSTSHDLGKMYFTYVINPLIVAEMIRSERSKVQPKKCLICERFKNFLKGLTK